MDMDAVGTVENLIADGLTVAVVTVSVRQALLVRDRRGMAKDVRERHDDLVEELGRQKEHYAAIVQWAKASSEQGVTDDYSRWLDLVLDGARLAVAPSTERFRVGWRLMVTEYGAPDMAPFFDRFDERALAVDQARALAAEALDTSRSQPRLDVVFDRPGLTEAAAAPATDLSSALEAVRSRATACLDNLALFEDELQSGAAPESVARRTFPDPLPHGMAIGALVLGVVCATVLGASYAFAARFPDDFGPGVADNLLSAVVVTFAGAGVAVIGRARRRRHTLRRAAVPGQHLLNTMTHVSAALGMSPADERETLLRSVAMVVRDRVNQLQFILPDARLAADAADLLAALDAAITRPAAEDQVVVGGPEGPVVTGAPSPAALDLLLAAGRVSTRVVDVYMQDPRL
jgi:hypothetical protein